MVLGLGLTLLAGCAEEPAQTQDDSPQQESVSQGVVVTPEFRLEGLDALGEGVSLQHVCMGIGEIRLEPLGDQAEDLIYITRSAIMLDFDVATGEVSVVGSPIVLPHDGDFMISIRIEPIGELDRLGDRSVRIDGLMARSAAYALGDLHATGEPTPLPMKDGTQLNDKLDVPVKWVPWTYSTQEVGLVLLNNVEFKNTDTQRLLIRFDLSDWLEDAMAPITAAVDDTVLAEEQQQQSDGSMSRSERLDPVDVSERVEAALEKDGLDALTGEFDAEAQGL
jgi:hypothetical protein